MTDPGTPTFDQLRVLLAVVETGTLAGAGRRLGRATSAASYAIDNLEAQLGVPLFTRQATRKLRLTEAGEAVLAEARLMARGMDSLRAKVKGLLEGLEAEVSVAIDVMFPTARLVDALQGFQRAFPTVGIRLHVEALGAVTQLVLEGVASVGLSGPLRTRAQGLQHSYATEVVMVGVAAPSHPLATAPGGDARDHVQLVLTDRSRLTAGEDFGVFGVKTWRLADLGAKRALLQAGVGWGYMPEHMVRDDIAAGRLAALHLPNQRGATYRMEIIHLAAAPPGPAARWLIARLRDIGPAQPAAAGGAKPPTPSRKPRSG